MANAAPEEDERPAWLTDPSYVPAENRPWANVVNRRRNGCKGTDFVFEDPKVLLKFWWSEEKQRLVGTVTFTHRAEGPPGGAHGASVLLTFDEILAYPVWVTGVTALTLGLDTRLKKMVPLGATLRFEAYVAKKEGRKRHLFGRITSEDERDVYAEATGLWIVVPKEKANFHGHVAPMHRARL